MLSGAPALIDAPPVVAPDVLYTRNAIVHDEKPGATVAPFNETVFTVHAVVVGETRTAEKFW